MFFFFFPLLHRNKLDPPCFLSSFSLRFFTILVTLPEKGLDRCFYAKNQTVIMWMYLAGSKRRKYWALTYDCWNLLKLSNQFGCSNRLKKKKRKKRWIFLLWKFTEVFCVRAVIYDKYWWCQSSCPQRCGQCRARSEWRVPEMFLRGLKGSTAEGWLSSKSRTDT